MRTLFLAIALAGILPAALLAQAPVGWQMLPDPAAQTYDDPFRDLTFDQLDALRSIVRLEARLAEPDVAEAARERIGGRIAEAYDLLAADGIDGAWILSQREVVIDRRMRAGMAANPALDGRVVALTGFLVSVPPAADGTRLAYLTPERGQCSHYPPPPPNQLVRLRLDASFGDDALIHPVRVTGRLRAEDSTMDLYRVDGIVPMLSSWTMEEVSVQPLRSGGLTRLGN